MIKQAFFFLLLASSVFGASPLDKLMTGNERFVKGESTHPNRAEERRIETAATQEPFAIIVACSDSRVAPEILFDQGIGDLFIVRVAGNVVGPLELDSIEYAALYLHSPLIFVMGHENCGAVSAVLSGKTRDIESIAALIKPAIDQSEKQKGNRLENAVKDNVQNVVNQLKNTPSLKPLIDQNKLTLSGGYYHFKTGKVDLVQ